MRQQPHCLEASGRLDRCTCYGRSSGCRKRDESRQAWTVRSDWARRDRERVGGTGIRGAGGAIASGDYVDGGRSYVGGQREYRPGLLSG